VKLVQIYECLCDSTRLRLLNLLMRGPLCVCHLQSVLAEPQVKISKHLSYLKTRGLVTVRREANWAVYALPEKRPRELEANLACLQDCAAEDAGFARDVARLKKLDLACAPLACGPTRAKAGAKNKSKAKACC
jgi:ArsR family transcriptional regulator, arsenate/arsenite/antimonite-responsive transcriptional repressor